MNPEEPDIIAPPPLSKRRLKILLGVLGIVILAIAGFLAFNPYSPLLYYLAHPKSYAECVKEYGVVYLGKVNSCTLKGNVFVEHKPFKGTFTDNSGITVDKLDSDDSQAAAETSSWKDYQNAHYNFFFKYPTTIFTASNTTQALPFTNAQNQEPSFRLVHSVPIEHCDLSGLPGHCTKDTIDISLNFTPLDMTLEEVVSSPKMGPLEDTTIAGIAMKTQDQGIEGEGNYYYLMRLPNNKTLLITRSYVSEAVMPNYQDVNGFIKFDDQRKLFEQIMTTFNTNN